MRSLGSGSKPDPRATAQLGALGFAARRLDFLLPLMRLSRALFAVGALVAALLAWPSTGSAALSCGLPEAQPTWIDFADGSVSFWRERFARPGVVVATGGTRLAAEARAASAGTVHWDMYLRKRVGTPSEPADPALMEKRADCALRLRRRGLRLSDAADRTERDVGGIAAHAAHPDRRALPGERPALRHAPQGARRTAALCWSRASPPRAATPPRGGGRSARSPTSCSRTTRTRISSGAMARSTARGGFVPGTASRPPSSSRSGSRRLASGS